VGIRREQSNYFVAAYNGKPAWSTKAFVSTVHKMEHHDVISAGISLDEPPDKHSSEWTKQTCITLEEAMEAYMVEVIDESDCWNQLLISCTISTCRLRWHYNEYGYSRNRLTCARP